MGFPPSIRLGWAERRGVLQEVHDEAFEAVNGPCSVLLVDALADAIGGPDPWWVNVLASEDEVLKPVSGERGEQVEEVLLDDLAPDRVTRRAR